MLWGFENEYYIYIIFWPKWKQYSDEPEISSEGSRAWLSRNQKLERGMFSGPRKNKNQEEEKTLQKVSRILIEMPLFPNKY